jgi:lysophospholipase L1-like esterase
MSMLVVLFGDSITEGTMSADYVEELERRMGADGHRFQNAGVGGDTAFNLLGRVPAVVAAQPDAVAIMVGTNDLQAYLRGGKPIWIMQRLKKLPQPMTLEWYVRLVRQIVETLQEETQASLALCSIPAMGEDLDDHANCAARLFNRGLEGIAEKLDVAYLPVHEAMAEVLRSDPRARAVSFDQRTLGRRILRALFDSKVRHRSWDEISVREGLALTTDTIHLNSHGAAIVADQVERWLRTIEV